MSGDAPFALLSSERLGREAPHAPGLANNAHAGTAEKRALTPQMGVFQHPDSGAVRDAGGVVTVSVVAKPRASKTRARGVMGDAVKIDIAAPPVEGEANRELVEFFARGLKIPKGNVEIVIGEGGRRKVVRLTGATAATVREFLQIP